jgi:hypothetical protein
MTSSWYLRNRLPNASTALGVGLRSVPGALWAGAKNIPAVLHREQGALGQMGRDIRDTFGRNVARNAAFKAMDTAGQAADNYASERRGWGADLANTKLARGLGGALRRVGNVATRTLTGENRMLNDNYTPNVRGMWGNFRNALAGEGASMAADYAGNQIKQRSPMAQRISDAWGRAKGAMGRGVDTLWDKMSGYAGARKEWSDYDKMKPINETYGGDPLAKAHDEMQRNIRENRGADISPDTMALLSPAQRFQFQNVQDEQRKALRERVAQGRQGPQKSWSGTVANAIDAGTDAIGNAIRHPIQTAQNVAGGIKNAAGAAINKAAEVAAPVVNAVKDGANAVREGVNFVTDRTPMQFDMSDLEDDYRIGGQPTTPPSTQAAAKPAAQPAAQATAIGAPATAAPAQPPQNLTPAPVPKIQQPAAQQAAPAQDTGWDSPGVDPYNNPQFNKQFENINVFGDQNQSQTQQPQQQSSGGGGWWGGNYNPLNWWGGGK